MAADFPLPPTDTEFPPPRHRQVLRALLALLTACAALGLLLGGLAPPAGLAPLQHGLWLSALGVLSLLGLAGWAITPRQPQALMAVLLLGAVLVAALGAAWGGWSLLLYALPVLGAAVCLSAALGGPWLGWGALVLGGVLLMAVALAQAQGLLPQLAGEAGPGWPGLALLLGGGLAVALLARLLASSLAAQALQAHRQARRQQGLLTMAADAQWATDASLRLKQLSWRDRRDRFQPITDVQGRRPWDLPVLVIHPDTQDLMRADAEARDPIRDLPVSWRCPDGQRRHYLVSGEPRFDERGRFTGYWGVARDVTLARSARAGLKASERRYFALFRRLPTPLLLHRQGRILQANAAAAEMLGYPSPAAMVGHDLLAEHMDAEQRELALDRLDELDAEPELDMLPAVPRRLLRCDGQPVYALATAWRADQSGGPAVLSLYQDESGQQAANTALQRSEGLLNRLVGLSADSITLSSLDSAQCLIANDPFLQLVGRTRAQLAEQSPPLLAQWPNRVDRDRLLRQVRDKGQVRDMPVDLVDAEGQARTLMVSAARLSQDQGALLLMQARDVTLQNRLRLERAAILHLVPVGVALTRGGQIVLANPQLEQQLGWPPGGLAGQPSRVVWPDGDLPVPLGAKPTQLTRQARRADGGHLAVRVTARPINPHRPAEGLLWVTEPLGPAMPHAPTTAPAAVPVPTSLKAKTDALQGMRVLLVDDNPAQTQVIKAMLEDWGVVVTTATDGPQALETVSRAPAGPPPFDLVLMDMQLPGMSGFETTAALRQRYPIQSLPVIALGEATQPSTAGLTHDVSDVLGKPIDGAHLRQALQKVRFAPQIHI